MDRWEVGYKRVSRGVLEIEHGLHKREKKREKVAVGQGPRECKAGYETNNCGELRVRWRELFALGEGMQNMGVLMRVLQTELGRYRFQISRHRER